MHDILTVSCLIMQVLIRSLTIIIEHTLLHALMWACQGNFGPEKFGPGDQCSMNKNGPPGPTFSWNISPVVEFGSAMQN